MVFCNFKDGDILYDKKKSHNPYFNRWFSAIISNHEYGLYEPIVTILILIDGFLQWWIR